MNGETGARAPVFPDGWYTRNEDWRDIDRSFVYHYLRNGRFLCRKRGPRSLTGFGGAASVVFSVGNPGAHACKTCKRRLAG